MNTQSQRWHKALVTFALVQVPSLAWQHTSLFPKHTPTDKNRALLVWKKEEEEKGPFVISTGLRCIQMNSGFFWAWLCDVAAAFNQSMQLGLHLDVLFVVFLNC